ncbi:MAG: RbsD/FucU family protein [Planctomycetaceae bacterium]
MLKYTLLHPRLNEILARAGHHATILIADGNYPASSKKGPNAEIVSFNLMPGVITCDQALQAVLSAVPVEAVRTMKSETTGPYALPGDPPVWDQYRMSLQEAGVTVPLTPVDKWEFYDAVTTLDHVLTIQTADQQRYANILLTIGVRME